MVLQAPPSLLPPLSSKTNLPSPLSPTYATLASRALVAVLSLLAAAGASAVVLAQITGVDVNNSTALVAKEVATMAAVAAARMRAAVLAGAVASAGRITTSHSATATRPSTSALTGNCSRRLTSTG